MIDRHIEYTINNLCCIINRALDPSISRDKYYQWEYKSFHVDIKCISYCNETFRRITIHPKTIKGETRVAPELKKYIDMKYDDVLVDIIYMEGRKTDKWGRLL